jgi:hypothetical protein
MVRYWDRADGIAIGPYRVYFFSHEPNEPPHVHVDRDDQSAKFWLRPVGLALNLGFSPVELRRIQQMLRENENDLMEKWNASSEIKPGERVKNVTFTEDTLSVDLIDGRTIVVPLAWYPRLLDASLEQRQKWQISAAGYGIHWPEIDEDLSTAGLLRGAPAEEREWARS